MRIRDRLFSLDDLKDRRFSSAFVALVRNADSSTVGTLKMPFLDRGFTGGAGLCCQRRRSMLGFSMPKRHIYHHFVSFSVAVGGTFLVSCSNDDAAPTSATSAVSSKLPYAGTEAPSRAADAAPAATANGPAVGETRTTASGLEYEVLRQGTGARPTKYNKVRVHYHGYLPNGTVFDSSVDRGQPSEFALHQVIPGWTEGLQLMREGAKYRFRIPHYLAYGERGSPPKIGPRQTLMFEVELIQILQ